MIIRPIYDLLLLPDVSFFFDKESFLKGENPKKGDEVLFLLEKEDVDPEEYTSDDFYPIGLIGTFEKIVDDNVHIIIRKRVDVSDIKVNGEQFSAEYCESQEIDDFSEEDEKELFKEVQIRLVSFMKKYQWDMRLVRFLMHLDTLSNLVCALSPYVSSGWEEKYGIIASPSRKERFNKIKDIIYEYIAMYEVSDLAEHSQNEEQQNAYKEMALKKKIEFLQKQLDDMHPENVSDERMFEKKINESGMNEEAKREAERMLRRLKLEGSESHEYGMLYDYLDFMTSLKWKVDEQPDIDLKRAEEVLDANHYGLKKVKRRIVEQLAIMALKSSQTGSILLFTGPPGTGKTSIGKSIAKALSRKYVRVSLGGVHDESEIRGHRRTYVGAMPGRIMDGIRKSGSANPVVVLDEVDKLGDGSYNGDPSSALLEVLDPEQNSTFTDHYLNAPYDLSKVIFVCTANSTDTIPEPLLNRMEVINFNGYTPIEKFYIAKEHLIPEAMKETGISTKNVKITDDAIRKIISGYTAEAGVRGLKKQINKLLRHVAYKIALGESKKITVGVTKLHEYLDEHEYMHETLNRKNRPGIVTGLAWTQAGGEILFIESAFTKGDGKLQITGQLGDVMKESVQIAVSLTKMLYSKYADKFDENDLHIHVPEGAVPKDGPSAGVTITTALISLITGKEVDPHIGMTGEISLRGYVMPIGGLPEKLMAAERAGVKKVLIPKDNVKDLDEVPDETKDKLEIIPVETIKDVVKIVFDK